MTSPSEQAPGKPRNWTLMVYMAAGDSYQLDTVAIRDLKEMELGCNDDVHVVVQINRHWPRSAQLYEITRDGARLIEQLEGPTRMGDRATLTKFMTDVVCHGKYPAANYGLVLWGHAFGIGFGRDEGDALMLPELRGAIDDFNRARAKVEGSDAPGRLELLGTNACTMSYLEAAFELRNVTDLMVASQITVPFVGWPYSVILSRIGPKTDARYLSKLIVDAYVTQFDDLPGGDWLAMTVLNLKHAPECGTRLEALASAINGRIDEGFDTEAMAMLRDVFMGAAGGDVRPLIDLTTLCAILGGAGPDKMVDTIEKAANHLLAALQPPEQHGAGRPSVPAPWSDHTLIAYRRAHPELADLKGVGIYAPFITDQGILNRLQLAAAPAGKPSLEWGAEQYRELELFMGPKSARGTWPHLVYDGLKRTIPAELMVTIDGIGELQSGDRADVAQIVMSIESVLNGLDRAIARARRDIVGAVERGPATPTADELILSSLKSGVATLPPTAEAKTTFGPPWLRLAPPVSLQTWREVDELKKRQPVKAGTPYAGPGANGERPDVVDEAVERFGVVERALSVTERTVLRALTHVRFGLGPINPNKLLIEEGGKPGTGLEPTKAGTGIEPTKAGTGNEPTKAGTGDPGPLFRSGMLTGDLRGDLAMTRVSNLFRQVGESLMILEAAAAGVEDLTRAVLVIAPVTGLDSPAAHAATAQEIDSAFRVLEEASADTRRTLRRVLSHPVYGLGPGEEPLSIDLRQQLALIGGLSRRHLKLL